MIGLENITPELATDLITLVNSLQKLPKRSKVEYSVLNKKTNQWNKKTFSYVPLDDILEKIKENKNFAFMQPIGFDIESQQVGVKCILIHKSGKYLESNVFPIKTEEGMKIQDEGAEITYRKRYAAGAFLGLATDEDTDGNDDDADPVVPTENKRKATGGQVAMLAKYYKGDNLTKLLESNNIKELEEIDFEVAKKIIAEIVKKSQDKKKENQDTKKNKNNE